MYAPNLTLLPSEPGIYKFFDAGGEILYIGKAKNIRKRVASYFMKGKNLSYKTERMVSQIRDIEYTITNSELDALLLENNLIKEHQPKYNVMLKDDKTYPWICIKNERFPRVFATRTKWKDDSLYFGPYANVSLMHELLDLIQKLYPLRNCNLNLSEENIQAKKFHVCLEYHLGNCRGPCEALQDENDYDTNIENIKSILRGKTSGVLEFLKVKMDETSARYNFELAQFYKEKYDLLRRYKVKSSVVSDSVDELDVYAISSNEEKVVVNFLKVREGAVIAEKNISVSKKIDEPDSDLLEQVIYAQRKESDDNSSQVATNVLLNITKEGEKYSVPKSGDKLRLVQLSLKNALYALRKSEMEKQTFGTTIATKRMFRILSQLQKDLHFKKLPMHIECFDNSNIHGSSPVAALVVFKNGKPSKADYKHFNIKTVTGIDDFASMKEVVWRRYSRCLQEDAPLPDLILIDGGKGQLSSAMEALEGLQLQNKIPVIGIAKKLEEIYIPNDSFPLHINKRSESLRLIQRIRDEAHRFAITFHRSKREKKTLQSELLNIKGIGKKTMELLLTELKSVRNISGTSEEELSQHVGKSKAKIIRNYFLQSSSVPSQ